MKRKLFYILLAICFLNGCTRNSHPYNGAYITPSDLGDGNYVVALHSPSVSDETITRPLPIDEARTVADNINRVMAGVWSGKQR